MIIPQPPTAGWTTIQPLTNEERIATALERIATVLEAISKNLEGTNERLDSMREGLACLNAVLEESANR